MDDVGKGDELELDELRSFAPAGPTDVTWETPPADLWDRISAELDGPGSSTDTTTTAPPSGTPAGGAGVRDIGSAPGVRRRRNRAPWLLAAAASVAVLAIGGWWLGRTTGPEVLAATPLDRLQEVGRGNVELVDDAGSLKLRLDAEGIQPEDGFLEVWVIDTEVSQLISLGPLRDDGIYDLPPGLDPESFPVVDVSIEPFDGDPTHSGDSVLRGQLEF